jgi:hypothetical protein
MLRHAAIRKTGYSGVRSVANPGVDPSALIFEPSGGVHPVNNAVLPYIARDFSLARFEFVYLTPKISWFRKNGSLYACSSNRVGEPSGLTLGKEFYMALTFDHKHYVPTLKWRQGEFKALATLDSGVKDWITPLIEVPAIPWDHEDGCPQRDVDDHLAKIPKQLETNWGDRFAFLDCALIADERLRGGTHPVTWVADNANARGLNLIPVTSLDRGAEYQQAVRNSARDTAADIALRLSSSDIFDEDLESRIATALESLGAVTESIHLILDLQAVDESNASVLAAVLPRTINAIPGIRQWRTVTFLGTAFPIDLSDVSAGVGSISRAEWELWLSLLGKKLFRLPTFGDYSIAHFDTRELDPRTMRVSASIRYTGAEEWHIFRGRWLRSPNASGFEQFRELSGAVINHREYAGPDYSWGDEFIYNCANGNGGTGNLAQWRQVGNSHHITYVARQVASLP